MKIKKTNAAFYDAYYRQLTNAKIKNISLEQDDLDYFVNISVILEDGQELNLELCSDPEGNSSGFLFGLPYPSMIDESAFD